jgi:hypothetical protein
MRLNKLVLSLIAAFIVAVVLAGCGGSHIRVDDPDKFIKDAQGLISKAEAETKSSTKGIRNTQRL